MNVKEIKEMIKLMNDNKLSELEIEKEGLRIKLRKEGSGLESGHFVVEKKEADQQPQALIQKEQKASEDQGHQGKTIEIKSPMVGTFYRAPNPESPPYVEIGQVIEPGQVICIIEAMKL